MPTVSICIPLYKQKKYLQACLNSIMEQDYSDYELIISDDTPDDSLETFVEALLKNRPYHYHRNDPSLGSPENWNSAIRKAKGKYIKVLHHDDFFKQKYSLREMVDALEKANSDFLYCDTDVWFVNSDAHKLNFTSDKQFGLIKERPGFLFFKNLIGAPSATMYKNDKALEYDKQFKWLVDVEFYIRYLKKHSKVTYLNKALVCTAHGTEGQMTGSVENDKSIQVKEHVLLYNKIKDDGFAFKEFFDYLFYKYGIRSFSELTEIVPEAKENETFFTTIIKDIDKGRWMKDLKKRAYESRYNNYIFRFEQFV
jgi:glycosyltransferase involved in cell wall biosynthesis